jgi:bisphosphoglycerate-independent phosphoglycerate mutase (AlkP superfamily)
VNEEDMVNVSEEDMVNHPPHYKAHPSGIEVIQITEHMNFCLGNAIKYILRADHKGNKLQDLEKAKWYLTREIERLSS